MWFVIVRDLLKETWDDSNLVKARHNNSKLRIAFNQFLIRSWQDWASKIVCYIKTWKDLKECLESW